jgi:hypothetical protein
MISSTLLLVWSCCWPGELLSELEEVVLGKLECTTTRGWCISASERVKKCHSADDMARRHAGVSTGLVTTGDVT